MTEQVVLATVVGVYGIKGWVKLKIWLEQPDVLTTLDRLTLVPSGAAKRGSDRPVEVKALRAQGKGFIAFLAGINDRDAAEAIKGWSIHADVECLPPAEEGEYFWRDLMGLAVWCKDPAPVASGEAAAAPVLVGEVDHLLETGANDVLVVRPTADSVDNRERLIPWIVDDVIVAVDVTQKRIDANWYIDE